jgi:hypothetical protein
MVHGVGSSHGRLRGKIRACLKTHLKDLSEGCEMYLKLEAEGRNVRFFLLVTAMLCSF